MATPIYYPHAVAMPSGNDITQIDSLPLTFNFQEFALRSASAVTPGLTGSHSVDPILQSATTQVADLLDHCTIDNIAAGLTGNVDVEWRKADSLTGRIAQGTASHIRTRATRSLLTWETLQATNQQLANVDFRLQFISDGTNAPLAVSDNVALGAAAAVQHAFTLGPADLTTTSLSGTLCVQGFRWDNQIAYKIVLCNGTGYVEYAAVDTSDPMVTLDVEDVSKALALVNDGEPMSALTIYLRKKLLGGINVANATAEHIKITASVGSAKPINPRQISVAVHSFSIDTSAQIT